MHLRFTKKLRWARRIVTLLLLVLLLGAVHAPHASAAAVPYYVDKPPASKNYCGDNKGGPIDNSNKNIVITSINLGCEHKGTPAMDLIFAIIRFLTTGVGLILVGSMVWAGIQYTSSRGDPNATAQAVGRIQSNVIALLLFVFAYAILNYIVPGTLLNK